MTRFVSRAANGTVNGSYANRQSGRAEEELPDNHPDLIAFEKKLIDPPADAVTTEDIERVVRSLFPNKAAADAAFDKAKADRGKAK